MAKLKTPRYPDHPWQDQPFRVTYNIKRTNASWRDTKVFDGLHELLTTFWYWVRDNDTIRVIRKVERFDGTKWVRIHLGFQPFVVTFDGEDFEFGSLEDWVAIEEEEDDD